MEWSRTLIMITQSGVIAGARNFAATRANHANKNSGILRKRRQREGVCAENIARDLAAADAVAEWQEGEGGEGSHGVAAGSCLERTRGACG
jgi:hypothetical protein